MTKQNKLDQALDSITIEKLGLLDYGEEVQLNDCYTLYHYTEDEVIVVNETETWTEMFQVLFNLNNNEITFEAL